MKDTVDKLESETESSEGTVDIPEEFQKECHELVDSCDDDACLSYLSNLVYRKKDEMRKSEESKKTKSKVPSAYDTAEMPS